MFGPKLESSLFIMPVNNVHTVFPECSNLVRNFTFLLYMASETEQLNNTTHSYARSHEYNKNIYPKGIIQYVL